MEFNFEVHTNKELNVIDNADIDKLRKMMATFEVMVNTTLPTIRVHLKES